MSSILETQCRLMHYMIICKCGIVCNAMPAAERSLIWHSKFISCISINGRTFYSTHITYLCLCTYLDTCLCTHTYTCIGLKILVRTLRSFNCESRAYYVGNPRKSCFFRVRERKTIFAKRQMHRSWKKFQRSAEVLRFERLAQTPVQLGSHRPVQLVTFACGVF